MQETRKAALTATETKMGPSAERTKEPIPSPRRACRAATPGILSAPWRWLVTHRALLFNLFKYVLAIGLLTYVVWKNWAPEGGHGLKYVWEERVLEGQIHVAFLTVATVMLAVSLLITIVRWYFLVRALDLPFTLPDALRLGFVALFFNTFLPGSVGGDIIKAAFLAREQKHRRTAAVATVILDRAIALWGLVCFVAMLGSGFWLTGFLVSAASKSIVISALTIVGSSIVAWLVLGLLPPHRAERFAGRLSRLPKVGHAAAEFWRAVWMYRCRKKAVALALVLSWTGHVGFVFAFYFSARTLFSSPEIPSLAEHFLLVPIGLVIQAAPLFPGGAGIGELGYGSLYQLFGCAAACGILASLIYRVVGWILGAFGYVVYLRMRPTLQAVAAAASEPVPVMVAEEAGVA
jgi:uncharacterized protein (TIRG00374 family)